MEIENAPKIFELELTQAQVKALQQFLPKGYKLEFANKAARRDNTPRPTKKVFTNEGNAIPVTKKPMNDDTVSNSELKSLTGQRALRDKKGKRHIDAKYRDFDDVSNSSSKGLKPMTEGVKKCYNLLQKLKKHTCSSPFLEPVDAMALGIPDYYQIITDPMDLSTIERNLKNGVYTSTVQFGNDIRKIWTNSFRYNARGSDIYQMTAEMSTYFEKVFKEIENIPLAENFNELQKRVERLSKTITELRQKGGKISQSGTKSSKTSSNLDKPMSMYEKRLLGQNIRNLPPEHLRGVWEIVSEGMAHSQSNKEELEFDIDTLPVRKTRELEKYVKAKLAQINKSQSKKNKKMDNGGIPGQLPTNLTPSKKSKHAADISNPLDAQMPKLEYPKSEDFGKSMLQNPLMKASQSLSSTVEPQSNPMIGHDDLDSKSSESSFITDSSASGSDDDDDAKQKKKNVFNTPFDHGVNEYL
jgi:hypothetical protein